MKRREFITLLGTAAVAWPLAARAQQPVIGFLHSASADTFADRLRAFRQGLKETGHVEGVNVTIEYRWAENELDRLPALAAELVRRQVTMMVAAGGTVVGLALRRRPLPSPSSSRPGKTPFRVGLSTASPDPAGT